MASCEVNSTNPISGVNNACQKTYFPRARAAQAARRVNSSADAVKVTLAQGRNVCWSALSVALPRTKDRWSQEIELKTSSRTWRADGEEVARRPRTRGDGTTTATVLAQSIVKEA